MHLYLNLLHDNNDDDDDDDYDDDDDDHLPDLSRQISLKLRPLGSCPMYL